MNPHIECLHAEAESAGTTMEKKMLSMGAAYEIERLADRVNRLRGLCKSASGWLLDAGDVKNSEAILKLIGDMEPGAK